MSNARNLSRLPQLGAGNATLMKNRIINGDMRIDQRNAGAEVSPVVNNTYYLDRWNNNSSSGGVYKIQRNAGSVTPPSGFSNYLGITSLGSTTVGAGDSYSVMQRIEGYNIADLAWGTANAKPITVSFWVRSSLTGTFGGAITNGALDRSYAFSYSIASANTWTKIAITISGDTTGTWATDNSSGLWLWFGLGMGSGYSTTAGTWNGLGYRSSTGATSVVSTSGATFYITGVQLEVGSSATGFEYVNYQTSLANCQRYYWQLVGANSSFGIVGYGAASNGVWTTPLLPVQMRTSPTVAVVGTWTVTNTGQPTIAGTSASSFTFQCVPSGTGYVAAYAGSSSNYITATAEL